MIEGIIEEIRSNGSFLITTHENPDGDAVGSSLALAGYLRHLGKDVTIHFCDPVPDLYTFLPLAGEATQILPDRTLMSASFSMWGSSAVPESRLQSAVGSRNSST